jgi:hypothetical protein
MANTAVHERHMSSNFCCVTSGLAVKASLTNYNGKLLDVQNLLTPLIWTDMVSLYKVKQTLQVHGYRAEKPVLCPEYSFSPRLYVHIMME